MRIHTIGDASDPQAWSFFNESHARFPLSAGKNNTLEHLEVMDPADLSLGGTRTI